LHCVYPFKTKNPKDIRRSMPLNFIINNTIRGEEIKKEGKTSARSILGREINAP